MDVILSWSGSQSRKVAEALNGWLKEVLPGIKPWISTADITKGSAWFPVLLGRLEAARLCIICVTPENVALSVALLRGRSHRREEWRHPSLRLPDWLDPGTALKWPAGPVPGNHGR